MKVTCQLCGTKFELENNDNRCPECAAYYHVDGMPRNYAKESTHQELKQVYDNNSNNTIYSEEAYSHATLHQRNHMESQHNMYKSSDSCGATFDYGSSGKAKRKSVAGRVVLIIEIIILVVLVTLPFIGLHAGEERRNQQRTPEIVNVENISMEEELVIGNTTVDFGQVSVVDTSHWNMPKGYQIIELTYETDTDYGKSSTGNDAYYLAEIYLKTTEGAYISALSSYDVQELSGLSYDEVYDMQIINSFGYDEGILYFLIRQDTLDSFLIQEYEGDYEVRNLIREYVATPKEVK